MTNETELKLKELQRTLRKASDLIDCLLREEQAKLDVEELNNLNNEVELEAIIREYLFKSGIPTNKLGFKYLKDAIMMAVEDTTLMDGMVTKVIYPEVAKKNNVESYKNVERAIRTAIEKAFSKNDTSFIRTITGCSSSKEVTNLAYISSVASRIRFQMKK